jgi:hypothetical protein
VIDPRLPEIASPDWVRDHSVWTFVGPLHRKDFGEKLERAAAWGATAVEALVFAQSKGTWHRTDMQPADPTLDGRDLLREYVDRCRELNMRAIGTVQMSFNKWYTDRHPECRWRQTDDRKYLEASDKHKGCWTSPFGQYMIDFLVDIAKRYPIDGFASDGFCARKICYCDYCRELYRAETGRDLPRRIDVTDPDYRLYIPWRDRKFNEYVSRLQTALKAVREDIVLTVWFWGDIRFHYWPFRHCSGSVNHLFDVPMLEMFWDWRHDKSNNLPVNFGFKWQTGIGRGRPVILAPSHKAHGMERMRLPEVERDFRIYNLITALSDGGAMGMSVNPGGYITGSVDDLKRSFALVSARREWLARSRPVKYAAMVFSEDTHEFFATVDHEDACEYSRAELGVATALDWKKVQIVRKKVDSYLYNCYGAFRALTEEHLPVDIIQDWDIEDGMLDGYAVVVLPNTAILSEKACDEIRRYVRAGGGLVATYLTSMSDRDGKLLDEFRLADVLGASFKGVENRTRPHVTSDRFHFLDHEITAGPLIKQSYVGHPGDKTPNVPFIGKVATVEAKPGAEVFVSRSARGKSFDLPAAIATRFGAGRVVYFPAAIDHAYFHMPMPFQRKLMVNAARYVATKRAPVEVRAPLCVYANFGEQKEKRRTIVHLLNETNTSGNRAFSPGDAPLREEVLPVAGIEILFRDPDIKRVAVQPEGRELEIVRTPEGVRVTLPPVGLHAMVVAER